MTHQDFLLNSNGDFPLQDTVVAGIYLSTPYGDSDTQHVEDLIFYQKGDLKNDPQYGFGVYQYINAEISTQTIEKNLNIELEKDGYKSTNGVVSPVNGGGFLIDDSYIFLK